ncbi:MAG: hypothetical protein GXO85_10785 [Chlorobi bacterium]|nr:hypothetical protein [Chlorobiota bacterium]
MKNIIRQLVVIGLLMVSTVYSAGLKANVASIDLTPPLEMKFALGGYGDRMSKPAEGIHDRIWAKALVLKKGDKKYAIVTMDMLGLPPNVKPELIKRLAAEGWTEENIMLLPSHSHTSFDMTALNDKNNLNSPQIGIFQPELLEHVLSSLSKVIREADKNLQVVRVGTGRITVEGMNRNRRGDPDVDKGLTVTRIDYENGTPMAVLVNWTAHPTFMSEKDMWVSGGWPGYLQRELQQWIDDGVTVMYYNGAEGDQSPIGVSVVSHYEKAEIYGRAMAIKAFDVYKNIKTKSDVVFNYAFNKVDLPKRRVHPSFMKTGGAEYNLTPEALDAVLNVMSPPSASVGAVRIGNLMIVGAPGELAAGLGLHIKNVLMKKGIKYPTIGGLANEWISYILSADQYNNGAGYESSVSFYGDKLGAVIVKSMLDTSLSLTH